MSVKPKTLGALHPNAGVEAEYRKRMAKLIDEMHRSIRWFVLSAYRNNEPAVMAMDAPDASGTGHGPGRLSATVMKETLRKLANRWQKRFDELAPDLARYFATNAKDRSDSALRAVLKKAGIAVDFKMTRAMQDILSATVEQNVGLIKSIPEKYLGDVQVIVMQSIQTGRDLGGLTEALTKTYGVTKRRAAHIALSQNNMATASMNRARQTELGIKEAIWVHSGGGKHPRPSHEKAGKTKTVYEVEKGWYDPDAKQFILPGQLINCRCTARSIIPGFI